MNILRFFVLFMLSVYGGKVFSASDDEGEFFIQLANHHVTIQDIKTMEKWADLRAIETSLYDQSAQNDKMFVYIDGDETAYRTIWICADKRLEWIGCPDRTRTYLLQYSLALNRVYQSRPDLFSFAQAPEILDAKMCENILRKIDPRKISATISYEVLDPTLQPEKEQWNILPKYVTLISGQRRNDKKMSLLRTFNITEYRESQTSDKAYALMDDVNVCLQSLSSQKDYDASQPLTILLLDNSRKNVLEPFAENITRVCNILIPEALQAGSIHVYPIELTYFENILNENQQSIVEELIYYFENEKNKY